MGFRNFAGPFQNLIDVVSPAQITATVPQNYFSVIGRVFGLPGNLVRYAIRNDTEFPIRRWAPS
jgi:hypothetical protein